MKKNIAIIDEKQTHFPQQSGGAGGRLARRSRAAGSALRLNRRKRADAPVAQTARFEPSPCAAV